MKYCYKHPKKETCQGSFGYITAVEEEEEGMLHNI